MILIRLIDFYGESISCLQGLGEEFNRKWS